MWRSGARPCVVWEVIIISESCSKGPGTLGTGCGCGEIDKRYEGGCSVMNIEKFTKVIFKNKLVHH